MPGCWCFGGGKATPQITMSLENGLALQPMIPDLPMPSDSEELEAKFADLVDELDLDKPHRDAMFSLPPEKKWQIYCSKKQEQEDPNTASWPDLYVDKLHQLVKNAFEPVEEEEMENRAKMMESLKAALRTQPLRFVTRFMDLDGLQCLVNFLSNMDKQTSLGPTHTSAIGCIKALMNNSYSRSHVLAHPTCINTIAQSLASDNIKTKVAVLEIFGALCMIPKGHLKVLEAMVHFQRHIAERARFQMLIYDLDRSYADFQQEIELKTAIMGFINAALKYGPGQEHIEFRMHLRYEFLMLGIIPIMDKLRGLNNDMLERHLDFFEMIRNQDERTFAQKFDLNHVDSKSAAAMLDVLKKKLSMSVAYPHLLSILYHLLQMPTNSYMPQYWQLIDRIVQQIVLQQKDGTNNDEAPLEINVNKIVKLLASENEIKAVQQKIRDIQKENDEFTAKLAKKERECEIRDEEKDELMEMVDKMKTKLEQEVYHHTNTKQELETTRNELNQLKSMLEAERGERQKFEHLLKSGSLPDDAKANIQSAAAMLAMRTPTPPAPPPVAPPPPPQIGGGPPAPPPPPGAPPPPGSGPKGIGLRQKKIPQPTIPLKSFNWTKLPDAKINGTVWMEIDDTKLFKVLNLEEFEKMFSAYQRHASEDEDSFTKKALQQKAKELSVVDGRRAQNCNILLSKLKMSNEDIAKAIMNMDSQEDLPKDMCEQLLKFVPTPEEKLMLEEHEHELEEMARADRFLYDMSRILHYEHRLNALYYKKKFSDRMGECKPRIDAVLIASRQVVQSRRLKKLLEIVLAYGNYMNRGQRGNASGFKLVSLNKIVDTKSCMDRKVTLLHYLIEVIEKQFPEVLKIDEEINRSRDAAKVSLVDLEAEIKVLKSGLKTIEQELAFHRTLPYDNRDKFTTTMKNFVTVASIKFQEMEENVTDMRTRYDRARKTFAEDEKIQPDVFFGVFDQFLGTLEEARRENERFRRIKEEEEKRTKIEAQMKAERQRRTMEKQRSMSTAGTEQNAGEFDELISALRTGDCFGEDLAKFKRNRRRGSQPANMERERVGNKQFR